MASPAAASAAAALARRFRHLAEHSERNLPPLSLILSLLPGFEPQQQWESGASRISSALLTAHDTPCAPQQQWEAGASAISGRSFTAPSAALPTARTALHKAAWRTKDPFHHGWGKRRCYGTRPILVRAIVSEIGYFL